MHVAAKAPNPLTQLELHCELNASSLSLTPARPALVDELALECDADGALVLALGNLLGLARPLAVTGLHPCALPDGTAFSLLTLDSGNWLLIPGKDAKARIPDMLAQEFSAIAPGTEPGSAQVQDQDARRGTAFWLQPGERCQLLMRQAQARRLAEHLG
ncbi:hypothetical protein [Marinobacterium rhizophilum]|uniref:CheW-like domain-containing protein n=1 Tax=Marinobacterium rhizophilum TaxID=420402 RepID=A0ABY5HK09_9GAMM|nr:hypothetical protein [Marinobacterium rhizophilum]UTW12625.1 hypothetical protein KDW95_02765 [Marinobacterium rhizophilum]